MLAQDETENPDIRLGVGSTILGTGDMTTIAFENELNYRISSYFTTALSAGYGRSNDGIYETASYLLGNLNKFLSPFKDTGRNDFRLGTGLSFMNLSDARLLSASYYAMGEAIETEYGFSQRSSYG